MEQVLPKKKINFTSSYTEILVRICRVAYVTSFFFRAKGEISRTRAQKERKRDGASISRVPLARSIKTSQEN